MLQTTLLHKPPTEGMIEILMDIHERELMKMPPLEATGGRFMKGLMLRGLVQTYVYKKKENVNLLSLRLTSRGYHYLKSIR